jgi:methionyl-tRNA formyltransferase
VRITFFGSPAFAVTSLTALLDAGHEIALVVSQPAKPAGRSGAPMPPAVARAAAGRGLPLFQPESLKGGEAALRLAEAGADLFVVVAYGKILRQNVLDLPRLGCVNVHGSLLPRWRGASPVQAALLAGDVTTGVSIMKMDAGMDTGPVYAMRETGIGEEEDAASLGARLAEMGAQLLVETLFFLEGESGICGSPKPRGTAGAEAPALNAPSRKISLPPLPQDDSLATYCPKISREDGLVDWKCPAAELVRRDRAFTPWPGLFTFRRKTRVKLASLSLVAGEPSRLPPGTISSISPSLVVACGEGTVAVGELQAEGRKRLPAADFVRGERVDPGELWPS